MINQSRPSGTASMGLGVLDKGGQAFESSTSEHVAFVDPSTNGLPQIRRGVELVGVALALLLVSPAQAAAYIDPITGSIIVQVLAAAALGALLTIKRVWGFLAGQSRRLCDGLTDRGRRLWEGVTGIWKL